MQQPGTITLETIGGGALSELFNVEIGRVLANIADPNTDESATRSISITVAFRPGPERDNAKVSISCQSKLAGIQSVKSQVLIGRRDGKLIAVEHDPKQQGLFDQAPRPVLAPVSEFRQAAAGGDQ